MTYHGDGDKVLRIADDVDDPELAHTDAVAIFVSGHLLRSMRPRIRGQGVDLRRDPSLDGAGELLEGAGGGWSELDPIGHGA